MIVVCTPYMIVVCTPYMQKGKFIYIYFERTHNIGNVVLDFPLNLTFNEMLKHKTRSKSQRKYGPKVERNMDPNHALQSTRSYTANGI